MVAECGTMMARNGTNGRSEASTTTERVIEDT